MLCVYCEIKSHYLQLELLSLILLKRTGILSLAIFTAHDACHIYVRGGVRNTFMLSAPLHEEEWIPEPLQEGSTNTACTCLYLGNVVLTCKGVCGDTSKNDQPIRTCLRAHL